MTDDLNTCWHEACHAVCARVVGLRVKHVTVEPDHPHARTIANYSDPNVWAKLALVDLAPGIIEPIEACRDLDDRRALMSCQQSVLAGQAFDETSDGVYEKASALREELRAEAHRIVRETIGARSRTSP